MMFNNSSNKKPSKAEGLFHSTKGEVKEGLGRTFASADLQQQGREERAAGEAQYQAAKGLAEGANNRVAGKKDSMVGSFPEDPQDNTRQN